MNKKGAVEIGLMELIGIALGIILIIVITLAVAKLIGSLTQKEKQSEIAFNSLIAKVNELIQNPSPLAYTIIPYFLEEDYALAGFGTSREEILNCGSAPPLRAEKPFPPCRDGWCLCLLKKKPREPSDMEQVTCAPIKEYDIHFTSTSSPHEFRLLFISGSCVAEGESASPLRPLFIIKQEILSTGKKFLLFSYGDEKQAQERFQQLIDATVKHNLALSQEAAKKNDLKEAIKILDYLLRIPHLTPNQNFMVKKTLCENYDKIPDSANVIRTCQDAIALLPKTTFPSFKLNSHTFHLYRAPLQAILADSYRRNNNFIEAFRLYSSLFEDYQRLVDDEKKRKETHQTFQDIAAHVKIAKVFEDVFAELKAIKFLDIFKTMAEDTGIETLSADQLYELIAAYYSSSPEIQVLGIPLSKRFQEQHSQDSRAAELARKTTLVQDTQTIIGIAQEQNTEKRMNVLQTFLKIDQKNQQLDKALDSTQKFFTLIVLVQGSLKEQRPIPYNYLTDEQINILLTTTQQLLQDITKAKEELIQRRKKESVRIASDQNLQLATAAFEKRDYTNAGIHYLNFFTTQGNELLTGDPEVPDFANIACKAAISFYSSSSQDFSRCQEYGTYCLKYAVDSRLKDEVKNSIPYCTAS